MSSEVVNQKSSGFVYRLFCDSCKCVMAYLDEGEWSAWQHSELESGLCFDCDPESAATTPSIFWQWQAGDLFTIGQDVFCVGSDLKSLVNVGFKCDGFGYFDVTEGEDLEPPLQHEHTHERERARVLSSYTNLNRTQENLSVLDELLDYEICPECRGQGIYVQIYGGDSCDTCLDAGAIAILPRWIAKIVCGDVVDV